MLISTCNFHLLVPPILKSIPQAGRGIGTCGERMSGVWFGRVLVPGKVALNWGVLFLNQERNPGEISWQNGGGRSPPSSCFSHSFWYSPGFLGCGCSLLAQVELFTHETPEPLSQFLSTFLTGCSTLHLDLLNFIRLLTSQACPGSSGWYHFLLSCQMHCSVSPHLQTRCRYPVQEEIWVVLGLEQNWTVVNAWHAWSL